MATNEQIIELKTRVIELYARYLDCEIELAELSKISQDIFVTKLAQARREFEKAEKAYYTLLFSAWATVFTMRSVDQELRSLSIVTFDQAAQLIHSLIAKKNWARCKQPNFI